MFHNLKKFFLKYNNLFPIVGFLFGILSAKIVMILVNIGFPNKGFLGVLYFPISEEIFKFLLGVILIILLKLDYKPSILLGLAIGLGFRLTEMHLKTQTIENFLIGTIAHATWVCLSITGYFRYKRTNNISHIAIILFSIMYHLGYNLFLAGKITMIHESYLVRGIILGLLVSVSLIKTYYETCFK